MFYAIIFYMVSAASSIKVVAFTAAIITLVMSAFMFSLKLSNEMKRNDNDAAIYSKYLKVFLPSAIALSIIASIMPSQQTGYLSLSILLANDIVNNKELDGLVHNSLDYVNAYIRKETKNLTVETK